MKRVAFPLLCMVTTLMTGRRAEAQWSGGALAVSSTSGCALLRCPLQKMEGRVSDDGLTLASTADNCGDELRIAATALGRSAVSAEPGGVPLPAAGKVRVEGPLVRWDRPGLTEEYSTSMDGVRQDFVIAQRPSGSGNLRVELSIAGARAGSGGQGAGLVLNHSGRKLSYGRLRAADASGRSLSARIEVISPNRLAICVDDTGAVYPMRIDPTFSDANWVSLGGLAGASGPVDAIAVDNNNNLLYIGGSFTVVGSTIASNVACWNGTAWLPLGAGINSSVVALAVDGSGNLYAGGLFTNAGNVAASDIAEWSGGAWSALGSGMNASVRALTADGAGNLYAGGAFTTAGGVTVNSVAEWNGSFWSALGSGMGGNSSPRVSSLLWDGGGNLYAAGTFSVAGGITASNVAVWNGSYWSPLGLGMNAGVNSLAMDIYGLLYAGGGFASAGGSPAKNAAVWNGSYWSAFGSGPSNTVLSIAVDGGGNVYAGGVGVQWWNGSTWSGLGSGLNGASMPIANALALDDLGHLYAGGQFTSAGGVTVNNLAQWYGSAWSAVSPGTGGPNPAYAYALALDGAGDLYAGGNFTAIGGVPANGVAKWNGTSWSALGSGLMGSFGSPDVSSLICDRAGNLYVGGTFTNAGGLKAGSVAKWNGSAWSVLGSGVSGGSPPAVYSMALDASNNLYVGGFFTTAGGVSASNIAKWNGSAWSALGSGVSGGSLPEVFALAFGTAGNLYAGGGFGAAGSVSANAVAKWNGSAWSTLGIGMAGGSVTRVESLAVDNAGNVYAGGIFATAGGITASNIAKWNGSAWSALGVGLNFNAYSLAFDPFGQLYVGGGFNMAGGVLANNIARWDGNNWFPLGSGLNNAALSVVADRQGHLYAAGAFTIAGTNASIYVVQANVDSLIYDTFRNADGSVTLSLSTTPYATNRVLAATGLAPPAVWQPIYTNVSPANGAWQFTDTNASHFATRFYRSSSP